MNDARNPLRNDILNALSPSEYAQLRPNISVTDIPLSKTLVEDGADFQDVYFPLSGMLSLVLEMNTGMSIEVATVGREGVVGAMACLGLPESNVRVVVQLPMTCARVPVRILRQIANTNESIRALFVRYNEVLLVQARTNAGCNALHLIEDRLSRWILQSADRGDGVPLALTHEFLSQMLGARRTSVNAAARKLMQKGLIRYSRGRIEILDADALKNQSCECYVNQIKKSRRIMARGPEARPTRLTVTFSAQKVP